MSIRIEIVDPHLMDREAVAKLAKYLMGSVGLPMATDPRMFIKVNDAPEKEIVPPGEKLQPGDLEKSVDATPMLKQAFAPVFKESVENQNTAPPVPHLHHGAVATPILKPDGTPLTGADLKEGEDFIVSLSPIEETFEAPIDDVYKKNDLDAGQEYKVLNVEEINQSAGKILAEHMLRDLDSAGFTWDKRIHSSAKSKTKDGRWKYMRNVSPQLIKSIEAELSGAKTQVPTPPKLPVERPAANVFAKNIPPLLDLTPKPKVPTPPPADLFTSLMNVTMDGIKKGKLTHIKVNEVLSANGVASLIELPTRPELIPQIIKQIEALING